MSDSERVRSPVAPGDVVAGKYRVEHVLGSGGMGVVVAATHLELDQPVALKFILPHAVAGKGNLERFMREARAAVRLKSEHVARVYDVGRDGDDRPFMVLELLDGMDLAKLSKQKGSLPVADAVEYVLQACEALVEAHANGIVHRDLKPQNLFVTRRLNGTPLLKVLDFGIAKAIGPEASGQMSLTDSSAIIGSPLYMAPEQMRSARTVEVRSDIWALGVILYELLGGQLPFVGETVTEVCIRVVNDAPPDLLELRPALDPALVAIVMRCLEKQPEMRWHNVSALATALEPFSRSAKQGGLVRPWRSFEDTQDSRDGAVVGSSEASGSSEDTGPSTAVTMQTMPPLDDDASPDAERRTREERRDAGQLASTDVTWGASSSGPRPFARPRSFSTGLAAGVVVSVAVAAVALGLTLGRGAPAVASAGIPSAAPPPAGSTGPVASAVTTAPLQASAPVASSAVPVEVAAPSPAVRVASSPSGLVIARPDPRAVGPRSAVPRPSRGAEGAEKQVSPSASAARAPEVKPTEVVAPNGAPILH